MIRPRPHRLIVATGGIGTGFTMALEGDRTLGREESRAARLLDTRDYCKLHIVAHYLQRLLGQTVQILPVGKVGLDDAGTGLMAEMSSVGLDLMHVGVAQNESTLFAVCFSYPNGDGGNLTTRHSASDTVTPEDVGMLAGDLRSAANSGVVVALPEVPLEARHALLRLGTEAGSLRVASFVAGEAEEVLRSGMLAEVDLIALNLNEGLAFSRPSAGQVATSDVVRECVDQLLEQNDQLGIVITAGGQGSWSWDGLSLRHAAAIPVEVKSTAGAGDAHLAGIVSALAMGVGLHEANRFGSVVGAMAVGDPRTINPCVNAASALAAVAESGLEQSSTLGDSLSRVAESQSPASS